MTAIVDSGSTKSDWRIVGDDGAATATDTAGFNPFFTDTGTIVTEILANGTISGLAPQVRTVHFYGAGCSSPEMNAVVEAALRQVFPDADVHVAHDLLGAALAAGQGEVCIAGILGTGSNACSYDGRSVDNGRHSLGYVLGDEGGGVWFGRHLIADHLHGMLPRDMHDALDNMGADRVTVLQRVYREPRPNTYLAGFMPVLADFRHTDYAQELLHRGMTAYLHRYVCFFPNHREVPLHLVGSVAYIFSDELKAAAKELDVTVGRVVRHPMEGLVEYHTCG